MKYWFVGIILSTTLALPLGAAAQSAAPADAGGGPPPAMQQQMEKAHAEAKASAYAALSPDHRAKVQAIVDKAVAGTLPPRDASAQIDALLTPDEQKAVLASVQHARDQMHAAMVASGAPMPGHDAGPPGAAPGAGAPPAGGPPAGDGMRHAPSAGRALLMVSVTPEQWHAMRHPDAAPAQ
jgi:hypothetical protein